MTSEGCDLRLEESRLQALDLSENNLQNVGVKKLVSSLKNPLCKLKKLRLSNCRLNEKDFSSLASGMRSNPFGLKELDLSFNKPGFSGIEQLCSVLGEKSCALEKLFLDSCDVTENMCDIISTALLKNMMLNELNLSKNELTDSGVWKLCLGLQEGKCTLKNLKLSDCLLTDQSCEYLATVLSSHQSTLKELDLSGNSISQEGAQFLSSISNINITF